MRPTAIQERLRLFGREIYFRMRFTFVILLVVVGGGGDEQTERKLRKNDAIFTNIQKGIKRRKKIAFDSEFLSKFNLFVPWRVIIVWV